MSIFRSTESGGTGSQQPFSLSLIPRPSFARILVKISLLRGSNRQSSVRNIFHVWTCDEKPRLLCLLDFLHQRIPSVLSAVYPSLPSALFIINNRNRISISPRARKYEQPAKDLLIKANFSWMNVSLSRKVAGIWI